MAANDALLAFAKAIKDDSGSSDALRDAAGKLVKALTPAKSGGGSGGNAAATGK